MAITFQPTTANDFERLLALRLEAMRPSLENLGRFDVERARARFRQTFDPAHTRLIFHDDSFVGCIAVSDDEGDGAWIEHFYLQPAAQGQGTGSAVLKTILAAADQDGRSLKLEVLKESPANAFYLRHGFIETHRGEWDIYYCRAPAGRF